jgi:hypothetical protein
MKNKNSSNKFSNKRKVILLAILALVGAVVIWYVFFKDPTPTYEPKYEPATSKSTLNEDTETSETKTNPPGSDLTSEDVPISSQGVVSITDLSQSEGYVNIATTVENFTVVSCVYQFTAEGARPIVKETDGVCKNASILENEFEKIGQYTFTVIVYGTDDKLTATRTIDIR